MKNHILPAALTAGTALLLVLMCCSPAFGWYPKTSQVELLTATWCGNCPDAYAGVDFCKAAFDRQEFNAIRYYDTSGGLGNADSQARLDYYGGAPYPRAHFDGTSAVSGGGALIATGLPYESVVKSLIDDPAYYRIRINSYDVTPPSGSIDLNIDVAEDVPDISNLVLRMALTEDNIIYATHENDDVTRDMLPETAITVDLTGESQHVNQTFPIDAGWTGPLKIVAFIQNNVEKTVLASAVTSPTPTYGMRYYILGDRVATEAVGMPRPFGMIHLYNTGTQTDNFTMSVTFSGPADWSAVLCDEFVCYGPTVTRSLAPGDEMVLGADIWPASSGYGVATITLSQQGNPAGARTLDFALITNDVQILLVDDDWLFNYESYFTVAMDYFGYTYGVWNHALQAPTTADLANFPIVIWSLGDVSPTINPTVDANDRAAIAGYLNGGGNLFMTGQDLSSDMAAQGGAAYTWFQTYMHAVHVAEVASDRTLSPVPGDPVSNDLDLVIQGGDGANNQTVPDDIDPAGGSTVIWTWDATRNGGVRVDTGVYKVVYLSFGFEAIDNAWDRRMVLRRIVRWFQDLGDAEDVTPVYRAGLYALPNPLHEGDASLRFTLEQAGPATLQVFTADGRLVRTLADGPLAAGPHVVSWDGRDERGTPVTAGVYYYKLVSGDTNLARKTVVLR